MEYDEVTKSNCIKLRKKFGNRLLKKSYTIRHKAWVEFVIASNLTDFEKEVYINEFLNPINIRTRYRKIL